MTRSLTGGILAGGAGRRLGGVDKGWYRLGDRALVEHTLARLAPQVDTVLVSANRSLERYRSLGWPVVEDDPAHRDAGPLAGLAALLAACRTPYLLTVPVDGPALPADLAARLTGAMDGATDIVVAYAAGRPQPLHALMRREVVASLTEALGRGVRRVQDWQAGLACRQVDWPDASAFININRPADAAAIARRPDE